MTSYELCFTILQHAAKIGGHTEEEIFCFFSLSRDLMWPGGQRNMWLHERIRIHLTISPQLANVTLSRDYKTSPLCQRILWLHRRVPLTIVSQPTMFGGQRPCGKGDTRSSFCHWTSLDHTIEGHFRWISIIINHHSEKFVGHWPCRREDILFLICHMTSYDHVVRGSCELPSL